MVTYKIDLDITPGGIPKIVHVKQYQTDATLEFKLHTRRGILNIGDVTDYSIRGTKTDGNGISIGGAGSAVSYDSQTRTVLVKLTEQMTAVSGRQPYEITLTDSTGKMITATFYLDVQRAALDTDTMSASEIRELINALDHTDDILQAAQDVSDATDRIGQIEADFEEAVETLVDPTLSITGKAADASATGSVAFGTSRGLQDVIDSDYKTASLTQTTTVDGYALDGVGGYLNDATMRFAKYSVKAGHKYYIRAGKDSDGVWQWQNGQTVNNTHEYVIGTPVTAGTNGIFLAPPSSSWLIVSQKISDTYNTVEEVLTFVNPTLDATLDGETTVSGMISGTNSGGAIYSNTARIITEDLYRAYAGDTVSFTAGTNAEQIVVVRYNDTGDYVSEDTGWLGTTEYTITRTAYYRFIFRRVSGAAITPSDYDATTIIKHANQKLTQSLVDSTLSLSGKAADAKVTGDNFSEVRDLIDVSFGTQFLISDIPPYGISSGWRLNESDGLCSQNQNYKIIKLAVHEGDLIKVVSDDRFQFQNSASVPGSGGITNRIGDITYGVYDGFMIVPAGATYLILSTPVNDSIAKASLTSDELEYVKGQLDNVFSEFEYGDIYISGQSGTYYDSSNRIRTKDRNGVYLEAGSTVDAVDVDASVEFFIAKKNGNNWSMYTSWTKSSSIDTADYYYIVAHYRPESAISDLADITSKIKISKSTSDHVRVNQCVADVDDLQDSVGALESKSEYSNYISSVDLELGDLYVNSSGAGTYYDSTSRIRTVRNHPMSLSVGDIVGMFDYSNAVYALYRKENNVYTIVSRNSISGGGWAQQDTYIDTAGDYEVIIKYPTEATITSFEALADQFFVKHKYGVLGEITGIENTTDIYKQELETTVASVVSKTTSRALIFAVLADTHVDRNRLGWYKQSMENLERLNNELHFNGIFHLGDIINGYYTAPLSKLYLKAAVDMMVRISPFNTYMIIGNHDNNNGAGDEERLTDTELYSIMHRYNEQYVVRTSPTTSSKYENPTSNYYFDYPSFKIRMVVFDSCYYGQGFSEDMMTWIRATFNSAPNDYNFVLWTHMSTEAELNGGSTIGNAEEFKALLAEYKDRILVYIHGHSHYDYYGYVNEFAQVALCCGVPDMPSRSVPSGGVQPSRMINTVTQDCINIVILLPDEDKIEVIRFGAGDDFTVTFRDS